MLLPFGIDQDELDAAEDRIENQIAEGELELGGYYVSGKESTDTSYIHQQHRQRPFGAVDVTSVARMIQDKPASKNTKTTLYNRIALTLSIKEEQARKRKNKIASQSRKRNRR